MMFRTGLFSKMGVPLVFVLFFCVCCLQPPVTFAKAGGNEQCTMESQSRVRNPRPDLYFSAAAITQFFVTDEMSDSYGPAFGAVGQALWQFESGMAGRLEGGLLISIGDPFFPDTTWQPISSDLGMAVFPIGGSFIYQLSDPLEEGSFSAYVGIGLNGCFGFERFSVTLQGTPGGVVSSNMHSFVLLDGRVRRAQ
jgi:hypothetical protein